MSHTVISADVGDSLHEVAARMRADDVSAMPVLDDGRLVGIVTERDLVAALVDGVDSRATRVSICMTAAPVSVTSDEDVSEAAFAMVRAPAGGRRRPAGGDALDPRPADARPDRQGMSPLDSEGRRHDMYRRILLAIDGHGLAENGLPVVAALAHQSHGQVLVVAASGAAAERVDDAVRRLQRTNVSARGEVLATHARQVPRLIADAATRMGADLVALGSHGRGRASAGPQIRYDPDRSRLRGCCSAWPPPGSPT